MKAPGQWPETLLVAQEALEVDAIGDTLKVAQNNAAHHALVQNFPN